jgi:HK97 family phage major capsid protein
VRPYPASRWQGDQIRTPPTPTSPRGSTGTCSVHAAKDEPEAAKFIHGLGHGSNEPEGLLVGATAVVTTAATATITAGDVYATKAALPSRFQPRAQWLAHGTNLDRIRRLTGPGSQEQPICSDGDPPQLLRRSAWEDSAMPSTATSGSTVLTYGDFSHFLIADRVGLSVALIPHLLGANRRPTGQRGFYAFWRSSSDVLAWQAFRSLKVL